jgi:hypothetical protein
MEIDKGAVLLELEQNRGTGGVGMKMKRREGMTCETHETLNSMTCWTH